MKHFIFLALMATVLTTACTTDADEYTTTTEPAAEPATVTLSFSPYQMEAMTRAGSVPDGSPSGIRRAPMTRAAAVSIADVVTRLDVWLYADGQEVQAVHQRKSDDPDQFGQLTLTLDKRRTYTLYATAHKGTGPATLHDGIITYDGDKVVQAMYCTATFTPAEQTQLSCLMERIIGQFILDLTDPVPDEVTRIDITAADVFTRWAVQGYGTDPATRTSPFTSISRRADGSASFSMSVLAPTDEPSLHTVTVTAYDQDGQPLQQRTFEDVPLRAGYKTVYRGALFSDEDVSSTFTVVSEWQEFDVTEF